jgi:hypothetical protein
MEIKKENTLEIKLKGEDVTNFTSIIYKVIEREKEVGFNKKNLSSDEQKLIHAIKEKL